MTTGAIVGIAVGASLLFIGGSALFFVYYRRQRAMYIDVHSNFDPRSGAASISPPLKGGFSSFEPKQMSQFSDYELRAQQSYLNNGAFYDKLEEEMMSRHPQYSVDPHRPGSGPQAALPTHPAYVPRVLSRNSHRSMSPHRPPPVKSNKPDSYALQVYLAAAEEAEALKLPGPPAHPPPAVTIGPDTAMRAHPVDGSRSSSIRGSRTRSPPPPRNAAGSSRTTALRPPPPPPPPRERPKVPSLNIPSVPRVRVPKQYAPPRIQVDGVDVADHISDPVVPRDEPRFLDDPSEGLRRANDAAVATQRIVEQQAMDRRPPRIVVEDQSVRTGHSDMYG